MHSIKNTVVAVGLLGLSFLFYQFSSKKPTDQSSELVAPFEVANLETDENANSGPNSAGLNVMGNPVSSQPSISNSASTAPPLSPPVSRPNLQLSPDLKPPTASTPSGAPAFPPIELQPMQPTKGNEFSAPNFNDVSPKPDPVVTPKPRSAPLDPQSFDPIARDQGLMAQLDQQKNTTALAPLSNPNDNGFSVEATTESDNSFMKLAGNESSGSRDTGVVSPDRAFGSTAEKMEASNVSYQDAWPMVEQMVKDDQLADALKLLSRFYDDSTLNGPQRQRLIAWLDGLAGKVIFSAEHRLAGQAYVVQNNETLEQLSQAWGVPAMLIFNVNRSSLENVGGTETPIPTGTQLKVIRGPFHGQIDREGHMLTLFLGDLYAGRFPVRLGIAGQPRPGEFRVMMKSIDGAASRDAQGNFHDKGSPLNSYGPFFLGLEGELCIHAATADKQDGHFGCFGLSQQDATDVFHILTTSSVIKVN